MSPDLVGKQNQVYVPILTYHQIADDEVRPQHEIFARDYTYWSDFVVQIKYLAAEGFTAVTHEQVYRWLVGQQPLPDKPVMITFDDGRLNVLQNAYPVLATLGWRATVYIITALADGRPACGHTLDVPAMNWEHLKVLRDAGWTIGSHTRNHIYLKGARWGQSNDRQLLEELEGSLYDIQVNVGITPVCFAYPSGQWSRRGERLVTQVYHSARLWTWHGQCNYCTSRTDPYRLPSMNISFHVPFDDFRRLVHRNAPSYQYQAGLDWNGQPRRPWIKRARSRLVHLTRQAFGQSTQ